VEGYSRQKGVFVVATLTLTMSRLGGLLGGDLRALVDCGKAAEDAGVDTLVATDHVVMGNGTDRYPYGTFVFPPDEPWPEPLIVLASVGAATERIRLATGILIAPARPAVLLAKTVATLDAITGGRVELGLGTGWQREEVEACGGPWTGRTTQLEDTIGACRQLWTGGPASFQSPSVSFEELWCYPVPFQPRLPIWLAGPATPGVFGRIAALGDGWLPMPSHVTVETLPGAMDDLRKAYVDAGRPADEVQARVNVPVLRRPDGTADLERSLEEAVPRLVDAGVTQAGVSLGHYAATTDDIGPFFTELQRVWSRLAV
jgi:probable F420-dependent oxidoreductase